MNRQQRRRLKREKESQETYILTKENIGTIRQEAIKEAFLEFKNEERRRFEEFANENANRSFELSLGIFLLFLRDKLGFGGTRLKRSMEQLIEFYNDWHDGSFNIPDILAVIEEETGYKLDFETDVRNKKLKLIETNGTNETV